MKHNSSVDRSGTVPLSHPLVGVGKRSGRGLRPLFMSSHLSLTSTLKGSLFKLCWIFTNAHKSRTQKSFTTNHYAYQHRLFSHFLLRFLLCVLEKLPMRFTFLFPKHPAQIPVWVLLSVLTVTVVLVENALGGSHPPMPRVNKVMCISIE